MKRKYQNALYFKSNNNEIMKKIILLTTCLILVYHAQIKAQVINGEFKWEARIGSDPNVYSPFFVDVQNFDHWPFNNHTEARLLLHVRDNEQENTSNDGMETFETYKCASHTAGDKVPGTDLALAWECPEPVWFFSPTVQDFTYPGDFDVIQGDTFSNATIDGNLIGLILDPTKYLIDNEFNPMDKQTELILASRNFENDGDGCCYYEYDCTTGDRHLAFHKTTMPLNGAGVNKVNSIYLDHKTVQGEQVAAVIIDVVYSFAHGKSLNDPLDFGELTYATTVSHINNSFDTSVKNNASYFHPEVKNSSNKVYYSFTVPLDGADILVGDNAIGGDGTTVTLYEDNLFSESTYLSGINLSKLFKDLCNDHTYTLEFEPNSFIGFDRPIDIYVDAEPTTGCLADIDYTYTDNEIEISIGVPDQTECSSNNNNPYMVFTESFNQDHFNSLKNVIPKKDYHVLEREEDFRGSFLVDFLDINATKTINVYHYRQQYGTGTGSDLHVLDRIHDPIVVPPGTRVSAKNYKLNPLSGSAADAIVFEVTWPGNIISIATPLVVEGIDLTSGIIGSTVRPDDIELIIYDPPGNGSYAGVSENFTVCREVTRVIENQNGAGGDVKVKFGVKGSANFIVTTLDYELSTSYNGSFSTTRDSSLTNSATECTTITSNYETSNDIYNIGENSDLFIGTGARWSWGYQDSIYIDNNNNNNNCSIKSDTAYVVEVTDSTGFVWSKPQLDGKMVELQTSIDDLAVQISQSPTDDLKIEKAQKEEQLFKWKKVLMDYRAKKNAAGGENFDWSCDGCTAGGTFETTVSTVRTDKSAIFIKNDNGQNFTATLGASGVEGGYKIIMNKTTGKSITTKDNNTKSISYTYTDGNGGDYHAGRITIDPDYGTRIFHLDDQDSKTSCPFEGGIRRDVPKISASICGEDRPYVQNIYLDNADPGNPLPSEIIKVEICNKNPSEDRLISWRVDDNKRTLGYQFNGSNNQITDLGIFNADQCKTYDLVLFQENLTSVFNDFYIRVFPTCLKDNETLLLAESDFINVNVTFSAPANYPNGDEDCDGIINIEDADYCSPSVDLSGTKSDNAIYASGSYIKSSQSIQSPAQVDYDAKTEVELDQGFEVQAGSVFHAYIDGCN